MASTASESRGLPIPTAAFLDDHPLFLHSSSTTFPDDQAASCFHHLPSDSSPAATAQDPSPHPGAARKPTRKRPRASRRPPTTVLAADASSFRAMVQEFTGFPAPPPFAGPRRICPGELLFGAGPSGFDAAIPAPQLLRQSRHDLPAAASHASLPNCTTSVVLDALALFAATTNAIARPPPDAGAATPSSGSELYSSSYGPTFAGDVSFDDGFEAAAAVEGEWAGPDHGLFSVHLHAGDRYHGH